MSETADRLVLVQWHPARIVGASCLMVAILGTGAMMATGMLDLLTGLAIGLPLATVCFWARRSFVFRRRLMLDRTGGYAYATVLDLAGPHERALPLAPDSRFAIEIVERDPTSGVTAGTKSAPIFLQLITGNRRQTVFGRPEEGTGLSLVSVLNAWLQDGRTGLAP